MKLNPTISEKLAVLQPNQIGLLAWSLLAQPLPMQLGGVPGQPGPDTPQPGDQPPTEPGEPTIPDEPPPSPIA